jgi:uncharacterized protein (TIGR03435 family)
MVRVLLFVLGACAVLALAAAWGVRSQPRASSSWREFSIGPASGRSASVSPDGVRSDGMTLMMAISVAWGMPQVRIVGPEWLGEQRFAIRAVIAPDAGESLPYLFQQELTRRLDLVTHREERDFDVLLLRVRNGKASALQPAGGRLTNINVGDWQVRARESSVGDLADVVQRLLAKPIIDETGIAGHYNFEFSWGENRAVSIPAALESRFGFVLVPGRRRLGVLVIDQVNRGAALSIFSGLGRVTSMLPYGLRRGISRAVAVH